MPTINDYRNKYPSLKALDDAALIDRVAEVQGVSREDVMAHMGYKPKPRGILSFANDTVIETANAIAGGVKSVGDFVAPGNPVSQFIDDNIIKSGEAKQSDVVKAEKARFRGDMENAEGVGDEVSATLGYVARNPIQSLAQAAGSFAIPGAAVKGAGMLATAGNLGAKGVARAGLAGGAVAGAALSGGDAAGTAYDLVKKAGGTDEEAEGAARQASVLPAAVGAAGGLVGAERLLAGAGGFKGGMLSRALKTAGVEGGQEAFEEGVTQYEGQRAAVPFDPSIDPMKGVAGAATMGAVLGGATGGAVSLLSGEPAQAKKPGVADILGAPDLDKAIDFSMEAVSTPAKKGADPLGLAKTGDGLPFEADPRFAGAPILRGGDRPAAPVFGSKQQADIYIGEQALFQTHEAVEVAPGRWEVRPTAATLEMLKPRTDIPVGEVTEGPPVGEARELTDEERAEYANAVPFSYRRAMERMPQPEVTELIPAGEATELEPIPVGEATEYDPPADMVPRRNTEGRTLDLSQLQTVRNYVERMRGVNTPAARAFVQDYRAGRITDADVMGLIVPSRRADPTPDERIAAAAAQAPKREVQPGDILTADGMPYGSKTAANVRAVKEGLSPASVIEIPGAGWVVRPKEAPNAADVARPGGQRADDAGRSNGVAGVPDQRPSDVLPSPGATAGQGVARAGTAGGGSAEPAALIDPKASAPYYVRQPGTGRQIPVPSPEAAAQALGDLAARTGAKPVDGSIDVYDAQTGQPVFNVKPDGTVKKVETREEAEARTRRMIEDEKRTVDAAPDALAGARRDLRGAMEAIDRWNDDWRNLMRDGVAYFQGDGKDRKLAPSAPDDIKERYARLKKQKGTLQSAYDDASARVQALTPAAAPRPAPAPAPVEAPAAPAPEVAKPRQLNGSDADKAAPLFQTEKQRNAPNFTEGQRVTLNGTPYTVTAANNSAVKLQGEDGATKMVARNSKTFGQIQAEAEPKAAPSDDYLKELFGASSAEVDADPFAVLQREADKGAAAQKADTKRIRDALATERQRAQREHDEWAGKVYKANKTQVDLRGDGPSNQASMSIGAINESRRRNALEALTQELKALDKLGKAIATDEGAVQFMARMRQDYQQAENAARDGGWSGMKTADDLFQYNLLDDLKFRGPGGKGNVTSNGLSKAVLAAIKPEAATPAATPATLTPKAQAVKEALAAKKGATPEPVATHKDPGEPAEPVTPAVVRESIAKAARNEDRPRSEMKADLLKQIDAAMATASDDPADERALALARYPARKPTKDEVRTYMVQNRLNSLAAAEEKMIAERERSARNNAAAVAERIGYVTFDVPGDGKFKVVNTKDRLAEFRKKVESSPGFKESQRAPAPDRDGSEKGSGSKLAAFDNMVNEGDLEAASDYADAVGLELDPKKIANATKVLNWREARRMGLVGAPAPQPEAEAPAPATVKESLTPEVAEAPKAEQAPADQAAAILNAAAEPPKGAERLSVIKDVKAGAITPAEVAAAYPAATTGTESLNKRHAIAKKQVLTPGGALKADATNSRADSAVWYYQGDMDALRFTASVTVEGKPDPRAEDAKRMLVQIKAAQDAGWRRANYRAGSLGTVWVFQRGDEFLTRAGMENAAAVEVQRPVLSEDRAGYAAMATQQFELARAFDDWLSTLPEDQQDNRGVVVRKMGETPVGDWARVEDDIGGGVALRYYEKDAPQYRVGFGARSWPELRAYVRELAKRFDQSREADENALYTLVNEAARAANAAEPGSTVPAGWVFAAGRRFTGSVDAEVAQLNAAKDGNEYREFRGGIIQRPVERSASAAPAVPTTPVAADAALWKKITAGEATPDEFKAGFEAWVSNKAAILAELNGKTKADLLKMGGAWFASRYKGDTKPEIAEALWRDGASAYTLGRSFQYGMGKDSYTNGIRRMVEATDADQLAQYVADRKAAQEEALARVAKVAEAIKDPKTLSDYQTWMRATMEGGKSFKEARMMLTPEQRAAYDELAADSTRSSRKVRADDQRTSVSAAGQTTAGEIIATKHTRDGHNLWVVKLADRVSKDDYMTLLASAKRMGGTYSSFRGNGAVPGFQFRTPDAAQAFLKLAGGDTSQAAEVAQERRNAFEDDRSQSAAERLTEMADRLEERADESLNRDRKANTDRRARFAASAEAAARADKAMAGTMRNIAKAIEQGGAKFLDRVRQKVQVEMLQNVIRTAKDAQTREKYPTYAEQEKHRGEPPDMETADYADFPMFTAYRSDLASLGRKLLEVDGTKKLGERLMKVADDVSDAFNAFVKEPGNLMRLSTFSIRTGDDVKAAIFPTREAAERSITRSGLSGKAIVFPEKRGVNRIIMSPSEAIARGIWKGDGDKRITLSDEFGNELVEKMGKAARRGAKVSVPWQFESAYDRRKQLARMGIETPAEFRAALREFIVMREQPAEADKIKAMERAMIGRRNDGLDFFPTPESVADEMVAAADIQPGMRVLEPSAGMGHIAERVRAVDAEPDVVEFSNDRRELLEAKGFNVVGRDFMEVKEGGYDRILMNPPFSDGRDIQHVRHAYDLLKPGGRLVAIMGEGAFFQQNKRATEFREWLESVGGTDEKLPEGTFNDPSLPVNTGANARMVVIEKPAGEPVKSDATLTADAVERADLQPAEVAALEAEYGATSGTTPFHERLAQDVADYINKGAEAIGAAIRSIVGKVAKVVLSIAVVFNVAGLNPQFSSESYARTVAAMPKTVTVTETVQLKQAGKADLNGRALSPAATKVVNWIGAQNRPSEVSLVLDPTVGRMYVLRGGKIEADAPALFGKQGVGAVSGETMNKLPDDMLESDKMTPAGRFPLALEDSGSIITFARAPNGNSVYGFHRVYLGDPKERRQQRLDSATANDNAVSFGCVNVSEDFYNNTLKRFNYNGDAYGYIIPSDPAQLDALVPMPAPLTATSTRTMVQGQQFADSEQDQRGDPLMADRRRQVTRNMARRRAEGEPADDADSTVFSRPGSPYWFSALSDQVEKASMNAGPASAWQSMLKNWISTGKVKADEVEWSGLGDWLGMQTGKVSKAQVAEFLDANGVQVTETVLGDPDYSEVAAWWNDEGGANEEEPFYDLSAQEQQDAAERYADEVGRYEEGERQTPKYANYTLPGGTNYREVLLTLPVKGAAKPTGEVKYDPAGDAKYPWAIIVNGKEVNRSSSEQTAPDILQEELERAEGLAEKKAGYKSGHWDQPNILAHIRVNDRTDASGARVLFVEEVQSDWAQEGKKKGFADPLPPTFNVEVRLVGSWHPQFPEMRDKWRVTVDGRDRGYIQAADENEARYKATANEQNRRDNSGKVPFAPFVDKTDKWVALALKRVIKMAVDGGYDKVAFVTGEQSADRYDLSKQVERIEASPGRDYAEGVYDLDVWPMEGSKIVKRGLSAQEVEDLVGKDMAAKIVQAVDAWREKHLAYRAELAKTGVPESRLDELRAERDAIETDFSGDGLKVGGEGMRAFYDKIVPSVTKDVLKKLGGGAMETVQIGQQQELSTNEDDGAGGVIKRRVKTGTMLEQPGFAITDSMRSKAEGGMAMFSRERGPNRGVPMADAKAVVARIRAALPTAPPVHLLETLAQAPKALREAIKTSGAENLEAAYHAGEIYVFPRNIPSIERMQFVVGHHEVRHHGIRSMLGNGDELGAAMHAMWDGNENLRKLAQAKIDAGLASTRALAVEEALADMDPDEVAQFKGWPRVMAAMRQWLRQVAAKFRAAGLTALADMVEPKTWTDADVARFVLRAEGVSKGQTSVMSAGGTVFNRPTDQTQTPTFRRWFGSSKVVDAEGKPLMVYHGTNADFEAFDPKWSEDGGLHFGTSAAANRRMQANMDEFREPIDGYRILPVYLSISNPLRVEDYGGDRDAWQYAIADAKQRGHDGLIYRNEWEGRGDEDSYVVFNPEQIKSATGNNGDFSPDNPSIVYSRPAPTQVAKAVRSTVADMLGNAGAKVSWWDKTLATQYAKAEKFPAFKRVFDGAQQYLEDVSSLANQAADKAPSILPKLETWKDLKKFGLSEADAKAVAGPIFTGTLTDEKVYSDDELRSKFNLTPAQIGQYREFLATVNESLDQVVAADVLRLLGDKNPALRELAVEDRAALRDGVQDYLEGQIAESEDPDETADLQQTLKSIQEKYARVDDLKAKGYAPLMRFGQYAVNVEDPATGESLFFGLYESRRAANAAFRDLQQDPKFTRATITQGVLSEEQYKLFSAVPMESLEMFAEAIGASDNEVFQAYLKLAKNNRSALKRMIQRKGTAGFSEDVPRVLAAFTTSNARLASNILNMAAAKEAAMDIRDGDIKDEAIKLVETVSNPGDRAGWIRGLMFTQFIGGSIASALVNLTQPVTMTLPYLSQFGGTAKASARLLAAGKTAAGGKPGNTALALALKRAEADGVVSPQEIHHLTAQASGSWGNHPWLKRAAFVWAAPFSLAEQFNRRVTFIAAWNTAKEQGIEDPFGFASKAVVETQGLYSTANMPNWARSPLGAAALTFKQFSIHYLEWMGRMWKSGPAGKKAVAVALALLILMAGTDGLPFADDMDDLVDTLAQTLGYDLNSKKARREFVANTLGFGDEGADVAARGFSALAGFPLDVSLRMSMGNLLPGSGILLRSNTDKSGALLEVAGPAGSLAKQYLEGAAGLLRGEPAEAAKLVVPIAVQNVIKGAEMAATGEARDQLGRKVMDVDAMDAAVKAVGFNPSSIARESQKIGMVRRSEQLAKNVEGEIAADWARAIVDKDQDGIADARRKLAEWNEDNPDNPIRITMQQLIHRAKKLRQTREQRFITTVAPERRQAVAEAIR